MSATTRATPRDAPRRGFLQRTRPAWRLVLAASLTCGWLLGAPGCTRTGATPTPRVTAVTTSTAFLATSPPTRVKPLKGGSVVVAIPAAPGPLNFSLAHSEAAAWILAAVDAHLVQLTPAGEYLPVLLGEVPTTTNGGISPDGLTWALHFRPKLSWSDGEPLTAYDFRFTWQTLTNQRYPAARRHGWSSIGGVTVADDGLTAILSLRHPDAALLDEVLAGSDDGTGGYVLPEHLLAQVPVEQIAGDDYGAGGHIGAGPFKVAKVDTTGQITVERNERYAGSPALLDRIVFRPVVDPREALGDLGTGEVDLVPSVPLGALGTLGQLHDIHTVSALRSGAVVMLAFNLDHPPLDDPAVRQALALGFDRQRLVDQLLPGQPPLATTPLAGTPWAEELAPLPYDPARAAGLLDAAGWTLQADGVRARSGVRLSLTSLTLAGKERDAPLRQQLQGAFVRDMGRLGIEIIPRTASEADLEAALAARDFDIVDLWQNKRTGLADFADRFSSATSQVPVPSGGNVMGYRSGEVDAAIAAALAAGSRATEGAALQAAQRGLARDNPVLPLFVQPEVDAAQAYVQGPEPGDRTGLWWNVGSWWLQREQKGP